MAVTEPFGRLSHFRLLFFPHESSWDDRRFSGRQSRGVKRCTCCATMASNDLFKWKTIRRSLPAPDRRAGSRPKTVPKCRPTAFFQTLFALLFL
jgi:hypothetical protein